MSLVYNSNKFQNAVPQSLPFGEVRRGYLYTPFGELMYEHNPGWENGRIPKYAFNAKELDEENGMYYYSARYYAPPTFISRDPMFEKYPSISPYTYCANNPMKFVDPDGKKVDVSLFDTKKTPKDANFVKYGNKIPTVRNSFQVLAHGNSLYMRNVQNGEKVTGEAGQINSAERFNQAFSNNAEWQNGKNTKGFNVILYSCNTGRGQNSLASKISDAYENINVIAPTRQVHISNDGTTGVYGKNSDGSKNTTDPGYWIVYQKGVAVEAYDATWQPGSSTEGHRVDLKNIPESHYKGNTDSKNYISIDKKTD